MSILRPFSSRRSTEIVSAPKVYALLAELEATGPRYDIGNKLSWIKATVELAPLPLVKSAASEYDVAFLQR